ncbi:tryptophan-rich sensory protein [Candidatus Micrarchaeota archaeon]|nr:tryptophan-rich sensory protein [Candidatus Micrarchaeota archaeon]
MKTDWARLAGCILLCEAAGAIGAIATFSSISTWYVPLVKPDFAPPNWVFGPAWTLLYLLMGVALYLVWMQGWQKPAVRNAVAVFGVQLLLNGLWSFLFFGLHSPLLALLDIVLLLAAIVWTMKAFWGVSRMAAYLLVPYLLWVVFATALNVAIWRLNP